MKTARFTRLLSFILCALLIAALALTASGCKDSQKDDISSAPVSTETAVSLGQGEKEFTFKVVTADKKEKTYQIKTDKATVGEALIELGLVEGEEGDFGLYVKKVDGVTADYDVDGTYWAFYVDGANAPKGVELTDIKEGSTYSFKVEK